MEELESLDRKALEQPIVSYHYSCGQKIMGGVATIVIILGIIIAGVFFFLSIINKITG
jgi:hypothetical protein